MARRCVLVLVALVCAASPAAAVADDLSTELALITVHGGPGGGPVTLGELEGDPACTPYSGDPIEEQGPASEETEMFGPPSSSSGAWALGTILSCTQPIDVSRVSGVVVTNANGVEAGQNSMLTPDDLNTTTSDFLNPREFPAVFDDGSSSGPVTYYRPSRSTGDENALDEAGGPVPIDVYEGPQINGVTITGPDSAQAGEKLTFTGTAEDSQPGVTFTWSFDDNTPDTTGSSATVTKSYSVGGTYTVGLTVTDPSDGAIGSAPPFTITVNSPASTPPATGSTSQPGNGRPTATSPSGPDRSSGTTTAAAPGPATPASHTTGRHHSRTAAGAQPGATHPPTASAPATAKTHRSAHRAKTGATQSRTPAPHTPATTPATSSPSAAPEQHRNETAASAAPPAPAAGHTAPAPSAHHGTARTPHRSPVKPAAAKRQPAAPLITGRLISDVVLVAADRSPLVAQAPPALATVAPVRQGIRRSILPIFLAVLAIVLLLGLGAGRELRGRSARRPLRLGL